MAKRAQGGSKADREFVAEAEELLERLRTELAALAEHPAAPEPLLHGFRAAHSLKALAGMFPFEGASTLAHALEDVLDGLRLGRLELDAAALALLEEAVRLFATLLEQYPDARALQSSAPAIAAWTRRTQGLGRRAEAPAPGLEDLDLAPSILDALTEYEEHRLRESLRLGREILLVEATFDILAFEEGLSRLSDALRGLGELLSTLPAPGESAEASIRFSLLAAMDASPPDLAGRLQLPMEAVRRVATRPRAAGAMPASAAAPEPTPAEEAGTQESLQSISRSVRVDIRKLDELMNLVGELGVQRGVVGALAERLAADGATARSGQALAQVHKDLERRVRELQGAVLDVRMVPLRAVFEKVSRSVRRLQRELDKDLRLVLSGADTELDKLLVEEIADPLMHVVRNAVDHAIEAPQTRREAGKDPIASIRIEALQRGSCVVIAVSDDGAGIDLDALRRRGRELGWIAPDAEPGERELLDLIFAPGLSTRAEVTETSGRGVGMDVVRANLAAVGGRVDVETQRGQGTRVSLTLPITLAILPSLLVGVGRQRFAIPLSGVVETLLMQPGELQHSDGHELLPLRGDPLPVRRLSELLGIPERESQEKAFVVVLGLGETRVGVQVERLEGQRDAVIKPIRGPAPVARAIAGATDLGDREPVLVLDGAALIDDALQPRGAS